MKHLNFYFQLHQPYRLCPSYNFFAMGKNHDYFDDSLNKMIMQRVAQKCYLPANDMMLQLIKNYDLHISFSCSGVFLEQCQKWSPEVIESFNKLYATGNVEFLSETYYHSLSSVFSNQEFGEQIDLHAKLLKKLFNAEASVFRNTELIYNDIIAQEIQKRGYTGILTEGADKILAWRSPNRLYQPQTCDNLALLLKNYDLSDDIAFRFIQNGQPLRLDDYIAKLNNGFLDGNLINIFMDYETFGEHQSKETGIFDFFINLIKNLQNKKIQTLTTSQVIKHHNIVAKLQVLDAISWADTNRDLSPWLGNSLQDSAMRFAYELEGAVRQSKDKKIIDDWRKLLISDHFYYMSTKDKGDGEVHKYFSPFSTPHDAYVVYTNVLNDLSMRLEAEGIYLPDLRFGWSQ